MELARSCRSYAELLRSLPDHESDPKLVDEARTLSRRADDIFARLRVSALGVQADGLFVR